MKAFLSVGLLVLAGTHSVLAQTEACEVEDDFPMPSVVTTSTEPTRAVVPGGNGTVPSSTLPPTSAANGRAVAGLGGIIGLSVAAVMLA
ncbi:uncharacterized protein MAM_04573 [Metarhizium album ARSEF 1941]|uniref:Uncharacterized protein n=1 Tax=Metarhizium album (strain ARSEF 1941) TaxID=1081103 RepID=A0A0B2WU21_METAS|nr:uncharacterized protein MAM_04573 [Metarhizium album ARSEF 1941]KHN97558.1 hypothetical protein MAM_04573 [Metarhizium album ARSEF 1941]